MRGGSGGSGNGNGLKTGSESVGMRSSELGSGAGDGTFLRSVAEAGESAVVTSFRSNGCRSKVGPTNVAERLTGKFLKVSTFSIAVAMILVLSLRLVSPRLFE